MIPEQDMANVSGMASANRRLARLGVEAVDMSACDHGCNAEAVVVCADGETRRVFVHGHPDPLTALDHLVDEVARVRRR